MVNDHNHVRLLDTKLRTLDHAITCISWLCLYINITAMDYIVRLNFVLRLSILIANIMKMNSKLNHLQVFFSLKVIKTIYEKIITHADVLNPFHRFVA